MTITEIIKQLKSCNYTCEAGPLENNVAFKFLEKLAEINPDPFKTVRYYEIGDAKNPPCIMLDPTTGHVIWVDGGGKVRKMETIQSYENSVSINFAPEVKCCNL